MSSSTTWAPNWMRCGSTWRPAPTREIFQSTHKADYTPLEAIPEPATRKQPFLST
jgi:hypothetical protein